MDIQGRLEMVLESEGGTGVWWEIDSDKGHAF